MSKKFIMGITGSPASGKTTFSNKLFDYLSDKTNYINIYKIEVNDVVSKYHLFKGYDKFGSKLVNLKELKSKLNEEISKLPDDSVIILVGHILSDISMDYNLVFVKRCHLQEVEKRMKARGYQDMKIRDNLIAEAEDYCGENIKSNNPKAKKVFEIISEKDIESSIDYTMYNVGKYFKYRYLAKPKSTPPTYYEELNELTDFIKNGNKYGL